MGPTVLALAVALHAHEIDVNWQGDPRCPRDGFQDSLDRYLAASSERRAVQVRVDVRRDGEARWSATLALTTAEARSTRTLRGRSCAEISDAAAFVTAVVVDPGVLARPDAGAIVPAPSVDGPEATASGEGGADLSEGTSSPPPGEPAAELSPGTSSPPPGEPATDLPSGASSPPASDESDPAAPGDVDLSFGTSPPPGPLDPLADAPAAPVTSDMSRETAETPAAPARLRGFVRVAGGLEALGMPRVGPTAGLAGGLLGRSWRAELTGLYRAPTTEFSGVDPAAGARVRMWAVGVRGCWVPRARSLEFPLCGGAEVGQVLGEGVGYVGARDDRFVWAALMLGPALAWAPRPWLALWLGADLGLPLRRGTFSATGLGTLFEIAPVSLRAALGLEFRFGRGSPG